MNENLANKIAAGEVVEKCVSIVKELVENSVDASASEIIIELKEAGLKEIKVIDNGIGMDREDAKNAFLPHATSKLYNDDDLFSITTLGFRGEALPSIASVSEVVLQTFTNGVSTLVHIKGGNFLDISNGSISLGTSICVSNLFYNTPARLKHLSSINSELANIVEYVNKMALAFTNIRFVLKNDDRELLNTTGDGNLLKVIHSIYGADVSKKMLKFSANNLDYTISGYCSLPEVNRASRNHISIIVNGRVVRSNFLIKTINEAYSSYKEDSRYPICILKIDVDPSLIDVNVHPSKLEIKFSNYEQLKSLVETAIKDAICDKLLIPKIEIKKVEEKVNYKNLELNLDRNIVSDNKSEYLSNLSNIINMNDNNDELDIINQDNNDYIEVVSDSKKLPELYPVGLVLGTYIVCQNEYGMYLIDQHAAQERINYEKFSYELSHPSGNVIKPIVPIIIEFSKDEFLLIKQNINILDELNIKVEEFGISSYRVISHPTWFVSGYEEETIRNIFEIICHNNNFSLAKFRDHLAATMACKASVKANTDIPILAMENIINSLRLCKNPYNCPHGRPTIISFSTYELEKMFKRSV